MKATFRQSMTWLHTWTGLLLGWVLFAIFLTGTATYFRWEITQWMQPEWRRASSPLDAATAALTRLEKVAPDSPRWFVELPDERLPDATLLWQEPGPRRFSRETFDSSTGQKSAARDSLGGEFFYRFHFQLQLPHPWGRYLAGAAAMFMLVALITGTIAHRHLFKEFFTLRLKQSSYRAWLDFHKLAGVLVLPFYLMISYSALVIFMALYMPWGRITLEPAGATKTTRQSQNVPPDNSDKNTPRSPSAPFAPMLDEVARCWADPSLTAKRIEIAGRGTERATVIFTRATGQYVSTAVREQLRFNGVTGELLPEPTPRPPGPGTATHGILYGLHLARFAGPLLRWSFFVMGLLGSALVATGLVLWTIKRRPKQLKSGTIPPGLFLVERLNIATIAGLPAAIATFFWSNRLLPADLASRADGEVCCFFITWTLLTVHPFMRPIMRAWKEQLWLGAALFATLPVVDAITGPYLQTAFATRHTAYLGFQATMLLTGAFLACVALRLAKTQKPQGNRIAPMGNTATLTKTEVAA